MESNGKKSLQTDSDSDSSDSRTPLSQLSANDTKTTEDAFEQNWNKNSWKQNFVGKHIYECDDTEDVPQLIASNMNDDTIDLNESSDNGDSNDCDSEPGPSHRIMKLESPADSAPNAPILCHTISEKESSIISLSLERINNNANDTEPIVIDDDDDNDGDENLEKIQEEDDDIEIVQVKIYSDPVDVDGEIEVVSQILFPNEVLDLMKHNLRVINQITSLSYTHLRVLLSHYRWNKDAFLDEYFNYGLDAILKALKLNFPKDKTKAKRHKTNHENDMGPCIVCFDDFNKSEMYASSCEHFLCFDCWNHFINTKVSDASSDDKLLCPGDNCSQIIDDDDLINIIQDHTLRDKYQRLITNNFVTHNDFLRWCPNGSCLHAVKVQFNHYQDIECVCKTVFCFKCGEDWHEPLSCDLYKNWVQKFASHTLDANSAQWLMKFTKSCPKCKFPIEKNGGCNYVMCTKCKHSFCFNCLGKCSHGRCIGFNHTDSIQNRNEQEKLNLDLQLYPFYKDNYQKQNKMLTIERKLQEDVCNKLETAVKSWEFKAALKFLKNAFSVLCHCRQTLMYSYVFGYYLAGPMDQINVYIENLTQLELQTTRLSDLLTKKTPVIHRNEIPAMKKVVQENYRNCDKSRCDVVQHIKQGLTNNWWQFVSP